MPERFKDGSEDGGEDIIVRKEGQTGDDLLTLEEFYDEIDSREGFYHGIMKNDPLMLVSLVCCLGVKLDIKNL